jgi:hypothetical protein
MFLAAALSVGADSQSQRRTGCVRRPWNRTDVDRSIERNFDD